MTRYILILLGVGVLLATGEAVRTVTMEKVSTTSDTAVASSIKSATTSAVLPTSGSYASSGYVRTYQIHFPKGYTGKSATPLMIALHGTGGTGKAEEQISQFDSVADAHNFIVVYPDARGSQWVPTGTANDIDAIAALIENLSSKYKIDITRLYVSGLSDGGGLAQILACKHADLFAGFASVANNLTTTVASLCKPVMPITAMFLHGTADPVSPYTGGLNYSGEQTLSSDATADYWTKKDQCGATPSITSGSAGLSDGTTATYGITKYSNCGGAASVTLYSLTKAGHTWPGGINTDPRLGLSSTLPGSEIVWKTLSTSHR